jgi:putative transposase
VGQRDLRAPAVRRLMALRAAGELTTRHVMRVAAGLEVSPRTVWQRVHQAALTPGAAGARCYAESGDVTRSTP